VAYLNQYRVLSTNDERTARALWGMLASEILNRNWDAALEELNRLKEIIDSKVFLSHLLIVCSLLRLHLYM
jgi:translation initiation factor 3 subunit E